MSDIHKEWHELRKKNGDFICHLDGEMAKLDKKQVELKRHEQMQHLVDAGAFAMQFVAQPPYILKDLNKAQADRIKTLEDELLARKEQQQVDLAVKKDLDEKLDKAAADYKALWVERDNLMDTISRMEKTIRDLDERNGNLRSRLVNTNESLKRNVQRESGFQSKIDYLEHLRQCQAKEIERLRKIVDVQNGSCSTYAQQGMQSKIAKQANEIKRLTEENKQLHKALDIAAKDANANFERGKIKGMQEIWKELVDCYDGRPLKDNNKIFGYPTVGDMLMNLSPTWFMNRAMEYHEQKENEEVRDIQIGDEVEIFDQCDHSLSDTGVVIAIDFVMDENLLHFTVIGPKFEGCFDETDIDAGRVRKTGQHFDSIPLNYFA